MRWVDWEFWSYAAILCVLGGIAAWDRVRGPSETVRDGSGGSKGPSGRPDAAAGK